MPEFEVAAQSRTETGKNANRRLRAQGLVPGVVYGPGQQAVSVAVSPKQIGAILRSARGENTLFDLELAGSRKKVILKEYQCEPVGGHILHADFYEVALDKPLRVKVPIELQGTPVGVKVEGGLLDFITREIDVECLPADIPEKVVVDVTPIELGKHLRVGEIRPPEKARILTDAELVVAHVVTRRAEEVAAPAAAAAEGAPEAAAKPEAGEEAEKPGEKAGEKPKPERKTDRKAERKTDRKAERKTERKAQG